MASAPSLTNGSGIPSARGSGGEPCGCLSAVDSILGREEESACRDRFESHNGYEERKVFHPSTKAAKPVLYLNVLPTRYRDQDGSRVFCCHFTSQGKH